MAPSISDHAVIPVEPAEADILDRLAADDGSVVESLMQRYGARVFRLALAITRNWADAQEVAQDVFLTVLRRHRTFGGRAALSTWMHRITVNAALNKRRGLRYAIEVSMTSLSRGGRFDADLRPSFVDPAAGPDGEALSRQRLRALFEVIGTLPEPYQRVIHLQIDGLPPERMAETLRTSPAAAKSRLHRARAALRRRLAKDIRLVVTL